MILLGRDIIWVYKIQTHINGSHNAPCPWVGWSWMMYVLKRSKNQPQSILTKQISSAAATCLSLNHVQTTTSLRRNTAIARAHHSLACTGIVPMIAEDSGQWRASHNKGRQQRGSFNQEYAVPEYYDPRSYVSLTTVPRQCSAPTLCKGPSGRSQKWINISLHLWIWSSQVAMLKNLSKWNLSKNENCNFLRFVWFRDNNPEKEVIEYHMKVHVFRNSPIYFLWQAAQGGQKGKTWPQLLFT